MEKKEIVSKNNETEKETFEIQNLIYIIRGKQVMLDSDLALLYQTETGNINRSMKRNEKRFPEDFCFQITKDEYENLKCQIGISNSREYEHGGRRNLPYVYTEQGIAMLSAILKSDIAIQVSIRIMKTFVELRKYLANHTLLLEKVNHIELRQIQSEQYQNNFEKQTNERFDKVFDYIELHKEDNQKIFYEGQIFDAFILMTQLVKQAEKTIILIDGYVDVVTLNILSKKKAGVDVMIYTLPRSKLTKQDIDKFNAQYSVLKVKKTNAFHDRFLLIDEKNGYHIGASIKDAGKKCFAINRIEDVGVINDLIQRAELTSIDDLK